MYRALDTEPISVKFVSFMYSVCIEKFRRKCIVLCIVIGGGHTRVAHADRVARLFDLVMMNDRIFPYLLHLVINEKSPN